MAFARSAVPILIALPLWACATAPPPPKPVVAGYLGKARAEALAAGVAAPPSAGSPADLADAAAVRAAQATQGSPRWLLAQADAELDPESALALFDCAVGAQLQAAKPPALTRLFERELVDAADAWTAAKARFAFRPKPYLALSLDPCTELAPDASKVSAYPAGHPAAAQVWARTLSELAPDRADAIQAKAREIGQSRLVCAQQYPSDVAAGETLGEALFQTMRADPAFQADLAAARIEVASARAAGKANPACTAERDALTQNYK
jgi:acid phosphatase (class A)